MRFGRDRSCCDGHHGHHDRRFMRGRGLFGRLFGDDGAMGHGRHGRGRLGRFFSHGDLRLVILKLIAEKPRHGYEIIKEIEDRVAGAYSPSPGVIYPTLTWLEETGYVAVSTHEGGKKLHTITPEGLVYLDANSPAVDTVFAHMEHAKQRHGGGPSHLVVRAVENLRTALHLRLSQGPLSDEQNAAIAAVLDKAATDIERI